MPSSSELHVLKNVPKKKKKNPINHAEQEQEGNAPGMFMSSALELPNVY